MANVDIDPFREHDRTELRTDETDENIPLAPVGGGSTWDQNEVNKIHHLEEEKVIELN